MDFAFHQLCPRYSGTLTAAASTAIRLWESFTLPVLHRVLPFLSAMDLFKESGRRVQLSSVGLTPE